MLSVANYALPGGEMGKRFDWMHATMRQTSDRCLQRTLEGNNHSLAYVPNDLGIRRSKV